MKWDLPLALAIMMSIIFTIALFFASTIIVFYTNSTLLEIFPDYGIQDYQITLEIKERLMPIGLIMLGITFALIIIGFIFRRGWLSTAGTIAFYLPVFGAYSMTMFYLAGIGILRVLWMPLITIDPGVFELGHIVLIPKFVLFESLWTRIIDNSEYRLIDGAISNGLILLGILIFAIGTATWFLVRLKDERVASIGIYKYSRHPQYLGFLLWSYGILFTVAGMPVPFGGLLLTPSLPWLFGLFIILAVASQEEISMVEKYGLEYTTYRDTTPFLFPLPRQISHILSIPIRYIFKKDRLESGREIAVVAIFYLVILIVLSVPFAILHGVYF